MRWGRVQSLVPEQVTIREPLPAECSIMQLDMGLSRDSGQKKYFMASFHGEDDDQPWDLGAPDYHTSEYVAPKLNLWDEADAIHINPFQQGLARHYILNVKIAQTCCAMPDFLLHPSQVAEFGFALALAKQRNSKQCYLLLKDADFRLQEVKMTRSVRSFLWDPLRRRFQVSTMFHKFPLFYMFLGLRKAWRSIWDPSQAVGFDSWPGLLQRQGPNFQICWARLLERWTQTWRSTCGPPVHSWQERASYGKAGPCRWWRLLRCWWRTWGFKHGGVDCVDANWCWTLWVCCSSSFKAY